MELPPLTKGANVRLMWSKTLPEAHPPINYEFIINGIVILPSFWSWSDEADSEIIEIFYKINDKWLPGVGLDGAFSPEDFKVIHDLLVEEYENELEAKLEEAYDDDRDLGPDDY